MMVRSLSALALVPPNQVGNIFNKLSHAFPREDDQDFDQITELLLYFEEPITVWVKLGLCGTLQ